MSGKFLLKGAIVEFARHSVKIQLLGWSPGEKLKPEERTVKSFTDGPTLRHKESTPQASKWHTTQLSVRIYHKITFNIYTVAQRCSACAQSFTKESDIPTSRHLWDLKCDVIATGWLDSLHMQDGKADFKVERTLNAIRFVNAKCPYGIFNGQHVVGNK